jgi:hypothetical protein
MLKPFADDGCFIDIYHSCGCMTRRCLYDHDPIKDCDEERECPRGYMPIVKDIYSRCCSAACCERLVEESEDFKRRKVFEDYLPKKLTRRDGKRAKWEDSSFQQLIRQATETEQDKKRKGRLWRSWRTIGS